MRFGTSNGKQIIHSIAAPTSNNKQDIVWFELDASNNQLHYYPWLWDIGKSNWKSPLLEYFFNYRNDYDAAIPIGGRNLVIVNADWWYFPFATNPTQVMIQLGTGFATNLFNVTTLVNTFNGGRVVGLNREVNTTGNASKIIELRFADTSYNARQVWGNIKLEYFLYR